MSEIDLKGRRCVVTGASSGLGEATVRELARQRASVILAVRSRDRGEAALARLRAEVPGADLEVRLVDLSSLASVRALVEGLNTEGHPLDLLVNNAGIMRPRRRQVSADGFELQFATNYLGPFSLTLGLLPLLLKANAPRVVTVTSTAATTGSIHFDDLQFERRYRPFAAYAQSKLADLLFAERLATIAVERDWPLSSMAAHPGFARTNLFSAGASIGRARPRRSILESRFLPAQSAEAGAEPLLLAATSPLAGNGAYYGPSRLFQSRGPATLVRLPRSARDPALAERLWRVSEQLTGASFSPDL